MQMSWTDPDNRTTGNPGAVPVPPVGGKPQPGANGARRRRPKGGPAKIMKRLRTLHHYHGWGAVFRALWLYAIRSFMRFDRIHVYALTEAPPGLANPSPESTRLATEAEAHFVGQSDEFRHIGTKVVTERWQLGYKLLLNIVDGRIAGCGWMNPHELFVEGVDVGFELEPNEIYIFDAFTHRDFRGKRLGHDRIMFWMRYIKETGQDTVLTDFPFDNPATLTRVDKFGFKLMGTVTRVEMGRWRSVRCTRELKSRLTRIVDRRKRPR